MMFAAGCLQLPPAVMPLPPSPKSLVILTVVFMIVLKILHTISGALPEMSWWWRIVSAPVKAMKLDDIGSPLSVCTLSRLVRKHRNHIDRKTEDVEMGPVRS